MKAESARASIPTVRLQPKSAEFRYNYRCLERFLMKQQIEALGIAAAAQLLVLERSRTSTAASRRRKILCIAATALCMISLQDRINTKRVTTFYPTQNMQIWDDDMFIKMFRFRREHLHEMLEALNLDSSKSILCGRQGRAQYFQADLCVMIVLRRMAFPCRFVDLVNVFGLPSHRICDIFHSTIDLLYKRYAHKLNQLKIWESHFPAFAKAMKEFGAPYDTLVGIFDGHDIDVCRPGGLGNLFSRLDQSELFAGAWRKSKSHHKILGCPVSQVESQRYVCFRWSIQGNCS